MKKTLKSLSYGIILILVLISCTKQSAQSKAQRSVEKHLSDSLANQKITFFEITKFDTITKFDSLQYSLNFIEDQIDYGTQQLEGTLHQKESFEELANITSIFADEESRNSVDINRQNINTTITNLQIGLENYEVTKNAIKEKLKDENLKNQFLGYCLAVKYSTGKDTIRQSFNLSNSFIVKK